MNQEIDEDALEEFLQMIDAQFMVGDIRIQFPPGTPPYSVQIVFAKHVIEALNKGQNALLASPTGTGKTLVLLCSTLAWQKHQIKIQRPLRPIIYASRTHSQLSQVVKQLHKTGYRPHLAILGSKYQYCVNPQIKGLENNKISSLCQKARKAGTCEYYDTQRIQQFVMGNDLRDIEDINGHCEQNFICPYFYHRARKDDAELILTPYNYLLQKNLQSQRTRVNVQDSIIIFDEAHNVSSFAEEGQSFSIQSSTIKKARDKLAKLIDEQMVQHMYLIPTAHIILQTLNSFCQYLENEELIERIKQAEQEQLVYPIEQLIHDIQQNTRVGNNFRSEFNNGINRDNMDSYNKDCWELKKYFQQKKKTLGKSFDLWSYFIRDLQLLYNQKFEQNKSSFKLCLKEYKKNEIELNIWCLNPQIAFEAIKHRAHSIILTSGSLSPLHTWTIELNLEFPIKLDGNHVINMQNSIQAYITQEFDFSFKKRYCQLQFNRLANSLVQVAQNIPNGILVVFTSYGFMNLIRALLESSNEKYQKLTDIKELFWEPKDQGNMQQIFESYKKAVNKGAMLFCVHRGKMAEGIDFSDKLCRGVILIGVPFRAWKDVKLGEKMKFIDSLKIDDYNSNEWYKHQAIRTTNQALGRVIRHIKDYGIILLFDIRYSQQEGLRQNLSHWVQPVLSNCYSVHQVQYSISQFFRHFEIQMDQEIINQIQQEFQQQPNIQEADNQNQIQEPVQNEDGHIVSDQMQINSQSRQYLSLPNQQGT